MARNEEKAQGLMNRWTSLKQDFASFSNRRPYLASECKRLNEAERWRRGLINEASNKMKAIQNASAGEHMIRDLNDQINKLFREKYHWDKRVGQLGGTNLRGGRPQGWDVGLALPGGGTYRYFGAARNLPGVKELFDEMRQPKKKADKRKSYDTLNPDYYGSRDDEKGQAWLEKECALEKELQTKAYDAWKIQQEQRLLAQA